MVSARLTGLAGNVPQWRIPAFLVTTFDEALYVLHTFQKRSRKTSRNDLTIGESRYREVLRSRGES